MTEYVRIENNTEAPLIFLPFKGPTGEDFPQVIFAPGGNNIAKPHYDAIAGDQAGIGRGWRTHVEQGDLEVDTTPGAGKKQARVAPPKSLKGIKDSECLEMIAVEEDQDVLAGWLGSEKRAHIKSAIAKRLGDL